MIMYHGSNSIFKEFDASRARLQNDNFGGGVAYLTTNKNLAVVYAKSMARREGEPIIYTVDANFRKTFDTEKLFNGKDVMRFIRELKVDDFARGAKLLTYGSDKFTVINNLKSGITGLSGKQIFDGLSNGNVNTLKARQILIKLGYDSLYYKTPDKINEVYITYKDSNVRISKIERFVKR